MRFNFKLWIIFFIFFLNFFPHKLKAANEINFPLKQTISMDLQDAKLKDILKILSIQSGVNFIASEALQDRTLTLYLERVSVKDAMDQIFKANNLTYDYCPESNIVIVKDWGRPAIETETRVFYLKYITTPASAIKQAEDNLEDDEEDDSSSSEEDAAEEGLVSAVKTLLSDNGSVIEEPRTNRLIVTDIPSRMSVIAQLIASLDIPSPQVIIDVEMLDVQKSLTDQLGFNFASASGLTTTATLASKATKFPLSAFVKDGHETADVTDGTLSFSSLSMVLNFLKGQTDTKYLARPKLLTLNNSPAEIMISTDESIGVIENTESTETSTTTTVEAERARTGVILKVTPQICVETNEITMYIHPQVINSSGGSTITYAGGNYSFRDLEERSTKLMVRIKDGETVIVGGLIRNEFTEVVNKLPFLGDIPILGALFRHRNKSTDRERELLVFITPHIVRDPNIELAQTKKFPVPEREQNTFSGTDRHAIIEKSLKNIEEKKK